MTPDAEPPEDTDDRSQPVRGVADAHLVDAARAGDPDAFGRLYDAWFDRVHDLAYRILWDAEAAADVAQDAFLAAWRGLDTLDDTGAFGGWLLRVARNRALDRKRKEGRSQPVDDERLAVIEQTATRAEDRITRVDDPVQIVEDAEIVTLLWSSAAALGERDQQVLDLSLRHGCSPNEIGEIVGMNRNAANQLVHRVRQRLGDAVGARVLWREGEPSCVALRTDLAAAGVVVFDADAVRVIERHARSCEACQERRETRLSPAAMFAALPIISIPALKAKVAAALSAEGVPMQGVGSGPSERGTTPRSPRGGLRRALLGTAAAVAIVVVIVVVAASRAGDNGTLSVTGAAVDAPTSTVAPSSTGPAPTSSASAPLPTTPIAAPTTIAGVAPLRPPNAPPTTISASPPTATTTTVTPPLPVMRLSVTPTQVAWSPSGYSRPSLVWSVTGAPAASVGGPNVASSALQGRTPICPSAVNAVGLCTAPRGTYTYLLEARDASGQVLDSRAVTLTIS